MFEQLLESTTAKKTRNPWAYAVSVTVQFIALGVLILIPLLYTEALPQQQMLSWLVAPPPPPPPPPPAQPAVRRGKRGGLGGGRGGPPSAGPPPPKPEAPKRIRVSSGVQEAKMIHRADPTYPPLAKQARIFGTVRLGAGLGAGG